MSNRQVTIDYYYFFEQRKVVLIYLKYLADSIVSAAEKAEQVIRNKGVFLRTLPETGSYLIAT